ncbi:hypothetical protein JD844_013712 [Phrynosoma platyrhinos]|uniref:Uncharacterized protein n=1 Tax=Phrynosoma platyrhinos TaxID=52577 RepID=A0ABQ7TMB9_PHRPL|nr:hypothetical protein JD844_013712 [Phrynosoma platyrhinos]
MDWFVEEVAEEENCSSEMKGIVQDKDETSNSMGDAKRTCPIYKSTSLHGDALKTVFVGPDQVVGRTLGGQRRKVVGYLYPLCV